MSAGRPARLAVGVVSAGRVGAVMGAALAAAGHRVVAASGVSRSSVIRAEALLPGVPLVPPDEAAAAADLVLLAVPDDVLAGLVRGLAAAECFHPGQIVVHTSGAQGVAVLDPATAHGVLPLALHPVMTFTGRTEDVARLAGASVAVSAAMKGQGRRWGARGASVRPRRRDGRRAGPRARGRPPALPRGPGARREPPDHAGTRLRRPAASAPVSTPQRLVAPLLSAALDNALRLRRRRAHRAGRPRRRRHRRGPTCATLDARRPRPRARTYVALARRTVDRALAAGG